MNATTRYGTVERASIIPNVEDKINELGRTRMLIERYLRTLEDASLIRHIQKNGLHKTLQDHVTQLVESSKEKKEMYAERFIRRVDELIDHCVQKNKAGFKSTTIIGVVGVAQGVTEYEREKEAAIEARSMAQAEKNLNDFMAHEVRNPLSVAMEALHYVERLLPPNQRHDVTLIHESLKFINDLLSSMLDLNKFEAGKVKLRLTKTLLKRDVLQSVCTMLGVTQGPVKVLCECNEDVWMETDAMRLKQVVMNLAKNAVKFTEEGWVRVLGKVIDGHVVIEVSDTGPGIANTVSLFQKYEQLNRHVQGTGIGLALCAQIVEAMNGTIGVDEAWTNPDGVGGPGVKMVVCVPHSLSSPVTPVRSTDHQNLIEGLERYRSIRILVVDDDDAVRASIVRRFLDLFDQASVDEAMTGEAAIRMVQDTTPQQGYAMITMDHYMATTGGRLTGAKAIQRLRQDGFRGTILGCSGNDFEMVHQHAGADLFYRKPLPDKVRLGHHVCAALNQSMLRQWNILVVEDEPSIRRMMVRRLRNAMKDATIFEACVSDEADQILSTKNIDLVFVDKYLGDDSMTGSELVRRWRETDSSTLMIGMSAASIEERHLAAGCNASWGKRLPLNLCDELLNLRCRNEHELDSAPRSCTPTTAVLATAALAKTSLAFPPLLKKMVEVMDG